MLKKITVIGIVLLLALFSVVGLAACGGKSMPYNAKIYGKVYEVRSWMNDDFYEAHLTSGAWSGVQGKYVSGDAYLKYQTIIVDDMTKFGEIFNDFPTDIDFEQKIIVMHCFTTASSAEYEISEITLAGQKLNVKYRSVKTKGNTPPNASKSLAKWVVVILDRVDISTAEFTLG